MLIMTPSELREESGTGADVGHGEVRVMLG